MPQRPHLISCEPSFIRVPVKIKELTDNAVQITVVKPQNCKSFTVVFGFKIQITLDDVVAYPNKGFEIQYRCGIVSALFEGVFPVSIYSQIFAFRSSRLTGTFLTV